MKGIRKKFEEEDYNRFDGPAKNAMAYHLTEHGHSVTVPPENYGVDLYSTCNEVTMYHEVEVSKQWETGIHPFPKGSVPERKHRLKEMLLNRPLYFWMLRLDLARAVVFNSKHLIDRWLVEVPNYKVPEGEYFYRIPKTLGKEFDLICP